MSARHHTTARTASLIGREHVRLGRNNQDGVFVATRGETTVAVVADGCSSQPFSEVGARLGARSLAVMTAALGHVALAEVPGVAFDHLTAWLDRLVTAVEVDDATAVLEQYGLFTVLCAVQRGADAVVFGSGDGAVFVDGQVTRLDSGEDNAPAYVGYRLNGKPIAPRVHHLGPATRIALATDGVDGWLSRAPDGLRLLLDEPHVWTNPAHLQRRLNVLNETERFTDDTTLAVLDTREL
ncbi:MAG: protein phosphatase 2C domain-containing protein [Myxococcaceae bacterium]|nr:protein phosphatase 2C domain-containing protein [Myxococcaceae bacterium]